MNDLIDFIILGFVQGITEFFPISSSGHLVLFQDFLEINNAGASAEIIAHFGTLFSILLFYKSSFFANQKSSDFFHFDNLKMLFLSTIPAVLCGLLFDFEIFFNYEFVKIALLSNGIFLILMSALKNSFNFQWNYKTALLLGFFQSIAMLPGISRSGMVISSALFLGLDKKQSIQYGFFMVVPVIILSIFYEILFSSGFDAISIYAGLALFSSSFIFGYLSLVFLIKFLERFNFWWFGLYCIIISLIL